MTTLQSVTDRSREPSPQESPPVPAARRYDDSDGQEHAEPGDHWPTLCGIPADQVEMYRHLFYPDRADACPMCAERVWRLDPSGPMDDFVSLVWVGDAPGLRLDVRAHSAKEASELLRMRFGDTSVVSVWNEAAANRTRGIDFVSEPERLATADHVLVISGAGFDAKNRSNNKQLAVERTPAEVIEIAGLLTDYQPGDPMDWMEWPAISIVFLKDRQPLAEYGLLLDGTWVRTPTASDREVREHERLRGWLQDRGVDPA